MITAQELRVFSFTAFPPVLLISPYIPAWLSSSVSWKMVTVIFSLFLLVRKFTGRCLLQLKRISSCQPYFLTENKACAQEAKWLLFCSVSFLSTSACSLASVLSVSALSRTLSSVFSFSRFSEASASSCSRLTASLSCRLFSRCCSSKLRLSRCSSAFSVSKARASNFSRRLSRHSCASCWERRSRAWCRAWTSRWSVRNSDPRKGLCPGPSVSTNGLYTWCKEPECCRMKRRRLGNVMGRLSGNFTLRCFLKGKRKRTQEWKIFCWNSLMKVFLLFFLTEVSRRTKNQTGIRIGLKHMNEATWKLFKK